MRPLNYRHLYYFWVVAKEGGMARAAQRLDIAIQTISTQVRELEKSFGHQLLKPEGRGLVLTEAGQIAYARAEEIFEIGQRIAGELADAAAGPALRLSIGLSDGLSKLAAHTLLDPVLQVPGLRLVCHEGEFEHLMAELALHHLDLVLAGQGAAANPNLRVASQWLVSSPMAWYGASQWVHADTAARFPQVLGELPVLLPTRHAPVRIALDRWFDAQGLRPRVVGEFEDSALMSSTANTSPCESKTGLEVQVSGMWVASKCSSRCTVSACPVLRQVPIPQVPACSSLQSAPRYRPALRRLVSSLRSPMKSTVTPLASVSSTT
jgi:LysR family transcriptional activator of nhaA